MMPRSETKPSSPSLAFWPESLASPEGAFGDLMKNAQSRMESNYRALSDETLQFINKRLAHNSESIELCRSCTDLGTFMTAQQKWLVELANDYYGEAVRMGELTSKMFATGVNAGEAGTKQQSEKQAHA